MTDDRHAFTPQAGSTLCVCGFPRLDVDHFDYLQMLLGELLADCENWGCAPAERYYTAANRPKPT